MSKATHQRHLTASKRRCREALQTIDALVARTPDEPPESVAGRIHQQIIFTVLAEDRTATAAPTIAAQLGELTTQWCTAVLTATRAEIACQAGCSWCCTIPVAVNAMEALAIADYLRRTMASDQLAALRATLVERAAHLATLTWDEHVSAKLPCAFLRDHHCTVYEARPQTCRAWTSKDVAACQYGAEHPFTGKTPNVKELIHYAGITAIAQGAAFAQAGCSAAYFELHSAVSRALEAPNAAQRWAEGDNVFHGVKRCQHMNDTLSDAFDDIRAAQQASA